MTDENERTAQFMTERGRLFGIAYRMTGSAMDAEDILQEVFIKWQAVGEGVDTPPAYLTTMTTRACIDYLRSARVQREQYVGEWLPEPIPTPIVDTAQLAESLSLAFLVILERLSPIERAVFLLREVFDYDYAEIATMLQKSEVNCRQIFARARKHVNEHRPRFTPSDQTHEVLLGQFMQACAEGNMSSLMSLLSQEAILVSDGGGVVKAALLPIIGADRIARFFLGLVKRAEGDIYPRFVSVNGQTGIAIYYQGRLRYLMLFYADMGKIQRVYVVANPHKLRRIDDTAL
jgi:RNA polymerase sigma-70 factor (ECF subfamily)